MSPWFQRIVLTCATLLPSLLNLYLYKLILCGRVGLILHEAYVHMCLGDKIRPLVLFVYSARYYQNAGEIDEISHKVPHFHLLFACNN